MSDTLKELMPLLVILPFVAAILAQLAEQLGVAKDMRDRRFSWRFFLFFLTIVAAINLLEFAFMLEK